MRAQAPLFDSFAVGLAAGPGSDGSETLARLRAEFDRGFTLAPEPAADTDGVSDYILLAAGGGCYALRTAGLRGIEHGTAVTPAPSRVPALLGVAGVRGAVVPVFSLAALLGVRAEAAELWWRAPLFALAPLAADAQPGRGGAQEAGQLIGLAFDRLLHFVRVRASDLLHGERRTSLRHEDELFLVLTADDLIHPLVAAHPAPTFPTENPHP